MFSAVYRRRTDVEGRREEMYALFAKTPEEVAKDDLEAIKAALETDNAADAAGKDYREASTALSLLLFLGDEKFPNALAVVFPDRGDTAGAIIAFRDFVVEAGRRPEKGGEAALFARSKAVAEELKKWPMVVAMTKRYTLNALLRVRDFASVRDMIRELCGEMVALDGEARKTISDLCNEFSGV